MTLWRLFEIELIDCSLSEVAMLNEEEEEVEVVMLYEEEEVEVAMLNEESRSRPAIACNKVFFAFVFFNQGISISGNT